MPCEHCSWLPLQPKRISNGPHATMHGAGGGVIHRGAAAACPRHHPGRGSWGVRAVMVCCCFKGTSSWCPSNGNRKSCWEGNLCQAWNCGGVTQVTRVLQCLAANPSEGTGKEEGQWGSPVRVFGKTNQGNFINMIA